MFRTIKSTQVFDWESEPKMERTSSVARRVSPFDRPADARPAAVVAWDTVRQPSTERDNSLSSIAADWMARFDPADRPVQLCLRYPRVANRLALCWPDAVLTQRLFESLLVDRRGTRQGFPAPVKLELLRLSRGHSLAGPRP